MAMPVRECPFTAEVVRKMYLEDNLNANEIADLWGRADGKPVSRDTVIKYMKSNGIEMRSKSEFVALEIAKHPEIHEKKLKQAAEAKAEIKRGKRIVLTRWTLDRP